MNELIIFRLGATQWALPADRVRQVLSPRPVTRLPDPPPLARGLIAWRGQVVPVVALGDRLDCTDPPVDGCTLLITAVGEELIALMVDQVGHLAHPGGLEEGDIQRLDLEGIWHDGQ